MAGIDKDERKDLSFNKLCKLVRAFCRAQWIGIRSVQAVFMSQLYQ